MYRYEFKNDVLDKFKSFKNIFHMVNYKIFILKSSIKSSIIIPINSILNPVYFYKKIIQIIYIM